MNKFKLGDFALLEGQLVEILDVIIDFTRNPPNNINRYKIKLQRDNLTHWVLEEELKVITYQKAPKVLYGTK